MTDETDETDETKTKPGRFTAKPVVLEAANLIIDMPAPTIVKSDEDDQEKSE